MMRSTTTGIIIETGGTGQRASATADSVRVRLDGARMDGTGRFITAPISVVCTVTNIINDAINCISVINVMRAIDVRSRESNTRGGCLIG
jgi:hypothetical protein